MVGQLLLKVGPLKVEPFHSRQATSQALPPMQVVVSLSLQTCSARFTPSPGTGPACPEILTISSVAWLIYILYALFSLYAFSIFTRKPLYSGVYALGSTTVGESRLTTVLGTLPASS